MRQLYVLLDASTGSGMVTDICAFDSSRFLQFTFVVAQSAKVLVGSISSHWASIEPADVVASVQDNDADGAPLEQVCVPDFRLSAAFLQAVPSLLQSLPGS